MIFNNKDNIISESSLILDFININKSAIKLIIDNDKDENKLECLNLYLDNINTYFDNKSKFLERLYIERSIEFNKYKKHNKELIDSVKLGTNVFIMKDYEIIDNIFLNKFFNSQINNIYKIKKENAEKSLNNNLNINKTFNVLRGKIISNGKISINDMNNILDKKLKINEFKIETESDKNDFINYMDSIHVISSDMSIEAVSCAKRVIKEIKKINISNIDNYINSKLVNLSFNEKVIIIYKHIIKTMKTLNFILTITNYVYDTIIDKLIISVYSKNLCQISEAMQHKESIEKNDIIMNEESMIYLSNYENKLIMEKKFLNENFDENSFTLLNNNYITRTIKLLTNLKNKLFFKFDKSKNYGHRAITDYYTNKPEFTLGNKINSLENALELMNNKNIGENKADIELRLCADYELLNSLIDLTINNLSNKNSIQLIDNVDEFRNYKLNNLQNKENILSDVLNETFNNKIDYKSVLKNTDTEYINKNFKSINDEIDDLINSYIKTREVNIYSIEESTDMNNMFYYYKILNDGVKKYLEIINGV